MPPLWMAYLAGTLKNQGIDFTPIDALGLGLTQRYELDGRHYRGLSPQEIYQAIPPNTQIIALSCMFSSSWPLARTLLHDLRKRFPNAILVLGGEHGSSLHQTVLEESPVDVVVMGEGEETAVELFPRLLQRGLQTLDGLQGIAWRDGAGAIHQEKRRGRIRAIDAIPEPEWEGIPLDAYFQQKCGTGAYKGPYLPILATRGCPYTCTFCTSPGMWTTIWLARDPAKVVEEMARLQTRYGVTDFQFQDLTAVFQKKWILAFCDAIQQRGLKATWQFPTGTRSEAITEEVAEAMSKAGCSNFALPFESADPAVLKRMKKHADTDKQLTAARHALKAGIRVGGFLMVGLPYETRRSLWLAWKLVLKAAWIGMSEMSVHSFVPLPGTVDFEALKQQGRIPDDDSWYDHIFHWFAIGKNTSYSPVLNDRGLRLVVLFLLANFFALSWLRRPWRLASELTAILRGKGDQGRLAKLVRGQRTLRRLKVIPAQGGI